MPELPEVETVRQALRRYVVGKRITGVTIHESRLREPVDAALAQRLVNHRICEVRRRAKYLLVEVAAAHDSTPAGLLLIHLGMSGRLRLVDATEALQAHDHVVIDLGRQQLRFNDPRRFGMLSLIPAALESTHASLRHLGLEPLEAAFDGAWLFAATRKCRKPIKNFLMDATRVVGVGNIYACESLFLAKVHPNKLACKLSEPRAQVLASAVKQTLLDAIEQGGTTLRDFAAPGGEKGYFRVSLKVYGRQDEPCTVCRRAIKRVVMAGRSTFYCGHCQR